MRLVYVAPGLGRGKCVRAAALLRRTTRPALVIITAAQIPDALTRAGIPYVVVDDERSAWAAAWLLDPTALVVDGTPTGALPDVPTLTVARLGRAGGDLNAEQCLPYSLPSEVLSRDEAADLLGGVGAVGVGTWQKDTKQPAGLVAPDLPACAWLAAADHVTGWPGCNLYWQVTACGVDALWLPSGVHDQHLRATGSQKGAGYRPPPMRAVESYAARIDAL